ncbi:unnamed protein product, partial [Allacma fusca]
RQEQPLGPNKMENKIKWSWEMVKLLRLLKAYFSKERTFCRGGNYPQCKDFSIRTDSQFMRKNCVDTFPFTTI